MESTAILMPPGTGVNCTKVFCFPPEANIPAGPAYEKNINTKLMHGEKFYQLHTDTTTAVVTSCDVIIQYVNIYVCMHEVEINKICSN